jgi:hypothetical protein
MSSKEEIEIFRKKAEDKLVDKDEINKKEKKLDLDKQKQELKNQKQDSEFRKEIFSFIKYLTIAYLVFVALIIIFSGFALWGFEIGDGVLIALLTTTTANIIALVLAITVSIFKKQN